MKHVLHVHQQRIRKGLPAIIDRTYKGSTHHSRLEILCPCGCDQVAAVFVHSPTPDSCGARVWIEAGKTRACDNSHVDRVRDEAHTEVVPEFYAAASQS